MIDLLSVMCFTFGIWLGYTFLSASAIKKRKIKRHRLAYRNGYSWAATSLLRGKMDVESISAQIYHQHHPFDRGASDALLDWGRKTGELPSY